MLANPRDILQNQGLFGLPRCLSGKESTYQAGDLVKVIVSSSHVLMWELDYKESWASKNWGFQTVMLEKTLDSLLISKEFKPVHPKGNQPEYSLERLMQKLQYFSPLMQRTDSLEKTLMLGKIEGKRRKGWQRIRWLDGITNLMLKLKFEQTQGDSEGQGNLMCCCPWGHKELDTT